MTELRFGIAAEPPRATHQGSAVVLKRKDGSPFIGRPASSAGAKAKQWWKIHLFPYRPKTPINEPLSLRVKITYPWRAKDAKIARTAASIPMPVKPDIDNLMKLILDAMTGCGFWTDDALVTDLTCSKRLGAKPGLTVVIRTFPEPKTTHSHAKPARHRC